MTVKTSQVSVSEATTTNSKRKFSREEYGRNSAVTLLK